MSLAGIVAALGGELHAGGSVAHVPAPGHSRADRSVSLLLDGDRVVVHGFGASDWREVRDYLRGLGLIDFEGRRRPSGRRRRSPSGRPPGLSGREIFATDIFNVVASPGRSSVPRSGVTPPPPSACSSERDRHVRPCWPPSMRRTEILALWRSPTWNLTAGWPKG